ncbi:hypothetical protein Hc94105_0298 [Helicobacter cinaedi]|uniref:hypothetical protein n=1 Tax=Helicobacter cinaedi TaxID=213 RepID=UPI001F2FC41A|nr:hypothetical protein [Helicobacter cinaedi]BDB66113.1 hypothetical protein Hc94105_0298 [Helicobacter cinaedi]
MPQVLSHHFNATDYRECENSPFVDEQYTIVFGCDDNYIKYASVAMTSIINSLSNVSLTGGGGISPILL